jgi:hypothetical protein
MQPIASTRQSSTWLRRNLCDGATCTTTVAPPPVLRPEWETLVILASTRSKPLDLNACPTMSHPPVGFMAQPTNRSLLGFETQTKKPPRWFWGPNHQTAASGFEAQTRKPSTTMVLRLNQEIVATGFDAKPEKTVPLVLRPNHRPLFWGSTKKPALLISTCTMQTAHSATRPLDRLVTEYLTCATILGPLHQVSYSCHDSRRCTPCRTYHLHTMRQANVILQPK